MRYLTCTKILSLLIITVSLQACSDSPGTWVNEHINSGKRDDFHKLNTEALQYIKADDMHNLTIMMSKELGEADYTNRVVDKINYALKTHDYVLMDEYYIVRDSTKADTVITKSPASSRERYTVRYSNTFGSRYIAFFVPKSGLSRSLISLIYYKYDYGWKISELDIAPYTINGETAPELFELAKKQLAANHLASAVNTAQLATMCLQPAEIWQYDHAEDISKYYSTIAGLANSKYTFPFVLAQVSTHPKIISIINQSNDDGGSYPKIYYISSIKIDDTDAIKKEHLEVKKALAIAMPGLDKDNKYLMYSVTNKAPTASVSVPSFNIVDKLQ